MIGKKYIKDLGFKDIDEFFGYIIESKINGNFRQTKELIKKLSDSQFLAFLNYLKYNDYDSYIKTFYTMRLE